MKKIFLAFFVTAVLGSGIVNGMENGVGIGYENMPCLAADEYLEYYEVMHISSHGKYCRVELNTGYSLYLKKTCLKWLDDKEKFIELANKLNWWNNKIFVSQADVLVKKENLRELVAQVGLHAIVKPETLFNNLIQYIETRIQEQSWAFDYQNGPIAKILKQAGLKDVEFFLKSIFPEGTAGSCSRILKISKSGF